MKLRFSPTSPYVRKVCVVALETGLFARLDLAPTNVWAADTDIGRDNPLGKVPALATDGGEVLFDSPVICEYLDSLHDGAKLFPAAGGARWTALRRQALADGILDASVLRFLENRRKDS
ncbi:MAG: glutathione S-transferase N-terminal domain-containing protein, partial [Pseudomonadota bacterium]